MKKQATEASVGEAKFSVVHGHDDRLARVDLAGNDALGKFVEDEPLQRPFDRTRAELRVVAFLGDVSDGIIGDAEVDA